jgi:hypothetical protein
VAALNDAGTGVVVADAAGTMRAIDLRRWELLGRFVGPTGSVRGLARYEGDGDGEGEGRRPAVVAAVGLDRMLRVFDLGSRREKWRCVGL